MTSSERFRSWSGSRGNRLPRTAYLPGLPIHVTICCNAKAPRFAAPALAAEVLDLVAGDAQALAACLMPDHLHWLLIPERPVSEVVGRFKSLAATRARRLGLEGPLWQRSFWDRVLREGEDVSAVIAYLVNNPVRAGLVARAEDWPYSVVILGRVWF